MELTPPANHHLGIKRAILSALLILTPAITHASLIYKIDAQQTIGSDAAAVSGFVTWDESLLTITNWHIETGSGSGVHGIFTEGAIFDVSGINDSIIGGETLQTFYTTNPFNEPHEFEIIWDSSPADASIINGWSIKETWNDPLVIFTHWRTGAITVSLVSAIPLPASVWLFGSGLLGLVGIAKRKKAP